MLKAARGGAKLKPLTDGQKSGCTRDNSFICGLTTTAALAASLTNFAGRPILDRTGIEGTFDILLNFDVYAATAGTAPPGYDNPDLFSALRNQLGLELEPQRALMPVLIVEKAERPGENQED